MKITIITAVYNRADTIAQAIESVAQQGYADVEHLVIDGASTDGTMRAIRAGEHANMRVISEPDKGIYDALNKGVAAATGNVIGLVHSDDYFAHDDVLAKVAECFDRTGADAVYGDLDYVSARDPDLVIRQWRSGKFERQKMMWGWMPPHPALFVRGEVFERLGAYDTSYQIAADYDAMLRWLWSGKIHAEYIPDVLVKMRVGGESNRSLARILRKSKEDYRAMRANGVGGVGTLTWKNVSKIPQFLNA